MGFLQGMNKQLRPAGLCVVFLALTLSNACTETAVEPEVVAGQADPFPSTYAPAAATPVLLNNATLLTGTGQQLDNASILLVGGKIDAIGPAIDFPENAVVIDASGKWITPGLIDVHSHLGVYPAPSHEGNSDGNEITNPNTAQVYAEHSVWTQDPQFTLALAGGVTTLQILPGSANLFGGRGVTLKNIPSRTVQAMKFPGAPYSLKMACGENPKRVYGGEAGQAPASRMANVAGYRTAWIEAANYLDKQEAYAGKQAKGGKAKPPPRNLRLETLAEVLNGNILVHNHCYRGEEMAVMIDVAKEFNYKVTAFHHAVEAYKVADILAEYDICAAMWPEWWGFKHEAYDMVEGNVAMVDAAGACAIVHSDSAITGQRLNQEAAKAMAAGIAAGYPITRAHAINWVTSNPAKALGVSARTGSLEVGKMADVVLWDGDPFSVYSKTEKVFIDGVLIYDRLDEARQPVTDFDLGIIDPLAERL